MGLIKETGFHGNCGKVLMRLVSTDDGLDPDDGGEVFRRNACLCTEALFKRIDIDVQRSSKIFYFVIALTGFDHIYSLTDDGVFIVCFELCDQEVFDHDDPLGMGLRPIQVFFKSLNLFGRKYVVEICS